MKVIDNFLEKDVFKNLSEQYKTLEFEKIPHGNDIAYKIDSGDIYKSHKKFWSSKPDIFQPFFDKLSDTVPGEFSLMVHIYEPGSEISWHIDYSSVMAYSFYVHPEWRSEWGGQLMFTASEDKTGNNGNVIDHRQDVMSPGVGTYIEPLPNRLVLIDKKNFHKVNRVNHRRVSFTGFLK